MVGSEGDHVQSSSKRAWQLALPLAVNLEEFGVVVPGCVHIYEIPEKSHPLLLSKAWQAKLGMVRRVGDGTISLDDYMMGATWKLSDRRELEHL